MYILVSTFTAEMCYLLKTSAGVAANQEFEASADPEPMILELKQ